MIKIPDRNFFPSDSDDDAAGAEVNVDFAFSVETELAETPAAASTVEETERFFAPDGPLLQAGRLGEKSECEFRPQQLAMGRAVANAVESGRNLAVEAPTGVGKSFAYLAPLVYRARRAARPSLVSTETISLQEQLMEKDIPLLRSLTGLDFSAALAKGRGNYLCKRRFTMLDSDLANSLLPQPSLILELERLRGWEGASETGERDSVGFRVDPALWQLICCEVGSCAGPKCHFYRGCFYYRARQQWETADIVVANHALFFTDLAMRGEGGDAGSILPDYGAVVIDEAHTLEDNAAEYLGLNVSRAALNGMLNRLFNPDNARGLLMKNGAEALELRQLVTELRDSVHHFFRPFEEFVRGDYGESRDGDGNARRLRDTGRFLDTVTDKFMELYRRLAAYLELQDDESFRTELQAQLDRCRAAIDGIRAFLAMSLPESVYYVELDRNSVSLKAAPLNVADLLNEVLFNQDFPVILSSATLTVRHRFDFYCGRVGFDSGDTLLLDSPFDRDQAQILVERAMPEPNTPDYQAALEQAIAKYLDRTGGKAFVLFTNYSTLRRSAEALEPHLLAKGIKLLTQGGEYTRGMMLQYFREDIDSVIFGTDSFWTGVDVPGEALSNVIVTKLPFPSPGNPLVAARCERIDLAGGGSFRDYMLPSAVLKFRQGAGRLIRSRRDRGIIVILDSRIIGKSYGRSFLDSLPYPVVIER